MLNNLKRHLTNMDFISNLQDRAKRIRGAFLPESVTNDEVGDYFSILLISSLIMLEMGEVEVWIKNIGLKKR